MRYEIKIVNPIEDSGEISFLRLEHISKSLLDVTYKSMLIRVFGKSKRKGKPIEMLWKSIDVNLIGLKSGSTALEVSASRFSEVDQSTYFENNEYLNQISNHTPISLLAETVSKVNENDDSQDVFADRSLIESIIDFNKAILNDDEQIIISNQNSFPELVLDRQLFQKFKRIKREIPTDEPVIIQGELDQATFSQYRAKIRTRDGSQTVYLSENIDPELISSLWGKDVVATGISYFMPNGLTRVEITNIVADDNKRLFHFSRKPRSMAKKTRLNELLDKSKKSNPLSDWKGKWPDENDTLNELIEDDN